MMAITREMIEAIQAELACAPHGVKGRILEQHARVLGMSVATLRRAVADEHHRRKRRKDAGTSRVKQEYLEAIARWRMKNRGPNMLTIRDAIWAAEQAEEIPAGSVSEGVYSRWERANQIRGGGPVSRFEAEYSNQLHQIDVSGSRLLWVVGYDKGKDDFILQFRRPGTKKLNPFADKHRARLWITGVVDDHTRIRYAEYFVNPGESAICVMNCLINAWRGNDARSVLRGLPDSVMQDNGSFVSSQIGKNFLNSLNIGIIPRMPYRARVGGKVERPFRSTKRTFEGRFRVMPNEKILLNDVNSMLMDYLVDENIRKHPFWRNENKADMYLRDLVGNIRNVPDDAAKIAFRRFGRHVNADLTVWYDNIAYKAPAALRGKDVDLCINLAGEVVLEYEGKAYIVEPFHPNRLGEYRAFKDTLGERLEKEAEEQELELTRANAKMWDMGNTRYMKAGGKDAKADTPFMKAIDGDKFNMEEALKEICWITGLDYETLDDDYRRAIEQQIGDDLAKESVRDYARELKVRLMQIAV